MGHQFIKEIQREDKEKKKNTVCVFTEISQVICLGRGEEVKSTSTSHESVLWVGGRERECLCYSRGKGKRALHGETWIKLTSSNSENNPTSRTLEATESKILNELHLFS